ncbi:Na/Pi cotransporter [Salipaludibacillus keqinensis]|uniref:Na/Pi cotransporter n=1 Tax=Salipaludibacillus keqinensis TaxID=2045207 RepID=A0A323TNB2_9BACI|nr:Na/Pi symporter [Salipaludibacillus keqinensis]PYZ94243.1 Na/Pi cotransporter [Salipaludibacillus keqinensis]
MSDWMTLFAIYLALFLFGMTVMRHGLLIRVHTSMPQLITRLVDRPWKGLLIGTFAATLLQSSSAVMVITVGLVSVKLIPFYSSVGIMLGANIGTVATLEILAFDLSSFILPFLVLGVLFLFSKKEKAFSVGCLLFGLAMMILAMHGFEMLAYPLSSIPTVYDWFTFTNDSNMVGIGVGIILTSIIQSSSAVSAMTMSFMNENMFTLQAAISIILGANIGTCITAWIASFGGSSEAKLTAYAHIWLNIAGVLLLYPFIPQFSEFISATSTTPAQQLAHAALLFNILCSIIVLPFARPFAHFIEKIHKKTE